MKNTFVNISGKLPPGLVALYSDVGGIAERLGVDTIVVGAMARDMVLVHGYGSTIERGTRDVDFGINVASWEDFRTLKEELLGAGFEPDDDKPHRLFRHDVQDLPWEIDIVPFGEIAGDSHTIWWPPKQDFAMSVLGFAEAFQDALIIQVRENPEITIPVASPAGMAILKLVAWVDREVELRAKDATDFEYLVQTYTKIPEIFDAVYEEGCMEAQGWDEIKASAMKLGRDAGAIALPETKALLQLQLFDQSTRTEQFVQDMRRSNRGSAYDCRGRLDIFIEAFLGADKILK